MERLKGRTLLLGKEPGQSRLTVAIAGTGMSTAIGTPGSVPGSVSRCKPAEGVAHAKIEIDQNGDMTLTNMKSQNVTYVNGVEIASKRVSPDSVIELGRDKFAVSLPAVLDAARKMLAAATPSSASSSAGAKFDISHLSSVWDRYERETDRIAEIQREAGRKRMLPIMVGSLSGVLSPILAASVAVNTLYITVPVAAVSFGLYFLNYKNKDTSYEDRKAATEKFTDEYVCPNPSCGKFLGNLSYKLLKRQYSMHCPYCKCEFIEKK